MNECPRSRKLAEALASEEMTNLDREALRQHAQACEDCRALVEAHQELIEASAELLEPSPAEFRAMRLQVLSRLPRTEARSTWRTFGRDAWSFLRRQPAGAALVLVALLAGAGLTGRLSAGPSQLSEEGLLRAIRHRASRGIGVAESWDEPLAYSNITIRAARGDRLFLSFDVSRHVSLVASQNSDLARDVVAHAILEPSPLGQRLKAISFGGQIRDQRLKDALILALREDPELAIRLRAFEVLAQYPFDHALQEVLLTTLRADPCVQLRLQALEFLVAKQTSGDLLRRTIDEGRLDSDDAVRLRAVELEPGS